MLARALEERRQVLPHRAMKDRRLGLGHGLHETLQSIIAALDEAKGSEAQDDDVTLVLIEAPG